MKGGRCELFNYSKFLSCSENPELYYQSYEDLVNNASELREEYVRNENHGRMVLTNTFLRDNYVNYHGYLCGCRTDEVWKLAGLKCEIKKNAGMIDPIAAFALKDLVEYRMGEYGLVNIFATILRTEDEIEPLKREALALNRFLYGAVDEKLFYSALCEALNWGGQRGTELFEEVNDRLVKILGVDWIAKMKVSGELPKLNDIARKCLNEFLQNEYGELLSVIQEEWKNKSMEFAAAKNGEKYQAGPEEIAKYFELSLKFFNEKWPSDVRVLLDENQSALSWNGEKRAVIVGVKRAPIKSTKVMFGKIMHELLVHGQRAVRGEKHHPLLGVGLFSNGSYLDFEEGLATILEAVSQGKDLTLDMSTLGLYINIALADKGASFDDIYEINWRLRALELMNKGKYLEENVLVQKRNAYNQTVRVFRGTPMAPEFNRDGTVLFYAKDLAYLTGKVKVIEYMNEKSLRGDLNMDELLSAKFDPMNNSHEVIIKNLLRKNIYSVEN